MHSFVVTRQIGGITTSIQVVYPSHHLESETLSAEIDTVVEGYNRRLIPSRLLFVCPYPMASKIQRCFEDRWKHYEGRLQSISSITVAPFDHKGTLVRNSVVHLGPPTTTWLIDDDLLLTLAQKGISYLFESTETILRAPHGYAFRKPSGREEDIFVRSGNLLRKPQAIAVFNHLLLRRLPLNCAVLYIDSFTILSFAMGLQSVLEHFTLPSFSIESFHSYGIEPNFWIPNEKNYMVLISASTSGGLSQKLVDEHQAEPSRIVHLLGVGPSDASFRNSCIYFHPRETTAKSTKAVGQANAAIEIRTEEFLISHSMPKPVRITTAHVDRKAAGKLHEPFYRRALQFGRSTFKRSYSPFSVSSDEGDAQHSPLLSWTKERLVHEIPASVRTLLHVDDSMAERFAMWVAEELNFDVVVKNLSGFDPASEDARQNHTIAVIAHDDPDLESLARASIALRQLPGIHRHYVVGYGFPSSRVEYQRRRADLRMSNRSRHGWSEFLVLPVGVATLHDSFFVHRRVLGPSTLQHHAASLGQDLHEALDGQGTSSRICAESLFLPRTDGAPLALRPGSVFLPKGSADVSQIAAYAMVAGAVQSAREPDAASGEDRSGFDDNPFVRTVLDPSMFARYSDGILQASLLRSTQRSELDYSGSGELSQQFASICSSVLLNHANLVGDAAPEFLYALATKKVLLREADHARIMEGIDSVPVLKAVFELFRSVDPVSEHLGG